MDRTTQCAALRRHFESGQTLTALEALDAFGCLNLKGRVWDLRRSGMDIVSPMVRLHNGKRVSLYSLRQFAPDVTATGKQMWNREWDAMAGKAVAR